MEIVRKTPKKHQKLTHPRRQPAAAATTLTARGDRLRGPSRLRSTGPPRQSNPENRLQSTPGMAMIITPLPPGIPP